MRPGNRANRFAKAIAALIALLATGPVWGQSFDLNHYILGCAKNCASISDRAVTGTIDATFTGSWYDPAQNGQGLSLEILPDNRVIAYWFTFNPDGTQQAWLIGTGTYADNVATIAPVEMPTGGRWIPNFDATKIVDNAWGTMTLTFDDADHGKVEFKSALGYGSGSMNLTRLTRPAGITTTTLSAAGKPWVITGNLNVPRAGHTATLLAEGRVLVAGGWSRGGNVVEDSAELYDPVTELWTSTGRMTRPRGGHIAIALPDGRVLVVGGDGGTPDAHSLNLVGTAEIYDPATGQWSATGSLVTPRAGFTATLLAAGKVLVAGGVDNRDDSLDTAELYDPASGTWSLTGKMKYGRLFHDATALADGRVLVTGGWGDDLFQTSLREAEIYDPDAGVWAFTASMHGVRSIHTSTLLSNGDVLVAGGYDDSNQPPISFNTAEIYSPSTGKWTEVDSMKFLRQGHTATLLKDGTVLVAGGGYFDGNYHTGDLSNAEIFDPATGKWSDGGSFDELLAAHSATLLQNGNVLIAGGLAIPDAPVSAAIYASIPVSAGAGMTGTWYDPMQSGHGLVVEALPGNRMLAEWFAFDPAGTQQSWFLGVGSVSGNTATIAAVDRPTGGRFVPNFDPSKIMNIAWGTLTLTFTDCDHGKVDFASTAGYGTGSMNLTRLTQPAGVTCP